jgi:hypothetical protein
MIFAIWLPPFGLFRSFTRSIETTEVFHRDLTSISMHWIFSDVCLKESVELINYLANQPTFKICVSSRPSYQFLHTVGSNYRYSQPQLYIKEDEESNRKYPLE